MTGLHDFLGLAVVDPCERCGSPEGKMTFGGNDSSLMKLCDACRDAENVVWLRQQGLTDHDIASAGAHRDPVRVFGLSTVMRPLGEYLPPADVAHWMRAPHDSLDGCTALEAVANGRAQEARDTAVAYVTETYLQAGRTPEDAWADDD